jgi:selenoprotein W-related protein
LPTAVSLTDDLLSKYKTDVKSLTLVPGGGGCFEVTLNGELIYSKLQTGEFPSTGQITSAIEGS